MPNVHPMEERTCVVCGASFYARVDKPRAFRVKITCGRECYEDLKASRVGRELKPDYERICRGCGTLFTTRRMNQVTCGSLHCLNIWTRERNRLYWLDPDVKEHTNRRLRLKTQNGQGRNRKGRSRKPPTEKHKVWRREYVRVLKARMTVLRSIQRAKALLSGEVEMKSAAKQTEATLNTELSELSVPELLKQLRDAIGATIEAIEKASHILFELHSRGERHSLMRDGVFRWFKEISNGQLSARTVIAFAGVPSVLSRLVGMPFVKQEKIADGDPITVVTWNAQRTDVVVEQQPVLRMSMEALELAFEAPGKFRSIKKQELMLRRQKVTLVSRKPVAPVFTADLTTGEICCGSLRFKPELISNALEKLGLKIVEA